MQDVEVHEVEVLVARPLPNIFKLFWLAVCTISVFYSIVLENWLGLGGWVLAIIGLIIYHMMEGFAIQSFNNYQFLIKLLEIKVLHHNETIKDSEGLTKDEGQKDNETSTN